MLSNLKTYIYLVHILESGGLMYAAAQLNFARIFFIIDEVQLNDIYAQTNIFKIQDCIVPKKN